MKQIRKKLLALSLLFLMALPLGTSTVGAETSFDADKMPISDAFIQILPEFDAPRDWTRPMADPPVIIFYRGTITNKTGNEYDGPIEIPIPLDAKNFTLIGVGEYEKSTDSNDSSERIDFTVDEEQKLVSLMPKKAIGKDEEYYFTVSYVMTPMEVTDKKAFNFGFETKADVENLTLNLILPASAKNAEMSEKFSKQEVLDSSGEQLYEFTFEKITADKPLDLNISYVKSDNNLPISPDEDSNDGGGSQSNSGASPVAAALIIAAAIIIFGVLVFFGLQGRQQPVTHGRHHARKAEQKKSTKSKSDSQDDQRRRLRKKFLAGEIDEEEYNRAINKLK